MTINPQNAMATPCGASPQEFGVLYFVDENPAFGEMLAVSLESLRRFHPEWPVRIVRVPSRPQPLWLKTYRWLSFWKRAKRQARFGQDTGIIARKVEAVTGSPFATTLYLDVDTVILRPLDDVVARARQADVLVTPLPWKQFRARAPWQPPSWPYLMSGVFLYSRHFAETFSTYLATRFPAGIADIPMTDMFVFSLLCHTERAGLRVVEDARLQLDVLNLAPLLGTEAFPRRDGLLDLAWSRIGEFGVFHYNEFKPRYLQRVRETWGLTGRAGWATAQVVEAPAVRATAR
ncbi:MAG: hypothetical protein K8T26_18025 [Lentisphaerae bacterium]|nr:hypothetical protein [Lentisphaerota bacterium]